MKNNDKLELFINESSQITYDTLGLILTRLRSPKEMSGKILVDCNPPSKSFWGYKIYHKSL